MFTHKTRCRHCDSSELTLILDLNDQPPANALVDPDSPQDESSYPLKLYVCNNCQLVQLLDVVDLDELFQGYVYFTGGAGATVPKHFSDYAQNVIDRFELAKDAFVVEMGSNDGLLLKAFKDAGITNALGIDPASNMAEFANKRELETLSESWSTTLAEKLVSSRGLADVIIGNNVVAHIDDHHDLFKGVQTLLKPSGVFIFEAPYLIDMFENLTFDTIYHEHLSCLSLRPICNIIKSYGLEVFDIELTPAHGVSMRVFIGKEGEHEVSNNVQKYIDKELELKMDTVEAYQELASRILERRDELKKLLRTLKKDGKRIAGYGAPAKSSTIINFLGIGPETIEYLTEELPSKIGKLSPGARIPLKDVEEVRKDPPDYFVLFAWNYANNILNTKEVEMRKKGTKFIIPVGKSIEIL